MRRIILIFLVIISFSNSNAQALASRQFTLKGKIEGKGFGYVYLYYNLANKGIADSCLLMNGEFEFKGNLSEPVLAHLTLNRIDVLSKNDDQIDIYIEPTNMEMGLRINDFKKARVKGSSSDSDRVRLQELKANFEKQKQPFMDSFNLYISKQKNIISKSDSLQSFFSKKIDSFFHIIRDFDKREAIIDSDFISHNANSFVALNLLWSRKYMMRIDVMQKYYENFPAFLKNSSIGQKIAFEIEKEKHISIGDKVENFIIVDFNQDTIRLESYKNRKYVLLDFWASWCGPCREIIPEFKKIYSKYFDSLEIISISIDENLEDWKRALLQDKATWKEILNNSSNRSLYPYNGLLNEILYVNIIPSAFLLNKELRIIAKFGNGYSGKSFNELSRALNEYFIKNKN